MKKSISLFLIFFSFVFQNPAFGAENNKFGIHITHEADLERAVELVNSNGGDWGYVTIVIQDNDLDERKWQDFFNQCREKHLIPLVRLATHLEGENWIKPTNDTVRRFAAFLNRLNWPIKTRYVIIFNEPNQANEWGGEVNPKEYAQILNQAIAVFKQENTDFSLLNAGFDQAAPNSKKTMDEAKFLKEMNFEVPLIFEQLDGWASHSYPNHGFIGKPWQTGKATVSGYKWEISYLKTLGNNKNLPVFITETGWPHAANERSNIKTNKFYSPEVAAEYLMFAYENVWLPDKNIIAITPFILNYPEDLFTHFSWVDSNGKPYPQFELVKNIIKKAGEPEQIEKYKFEKFFYSPFLPTNFEFKGKLVLENIGQSIWGEKQFSIKGEGKGIIVSYLVLPAKVIVKPGDKYAFDFRIKTGTESGDFYFSWDGSDQYPIKVFDVWKLRNDKNYLTETELSINRISSFFKNLMKECLDPLINGLGSLFDREI